jgi:prepilin signal peptidase PulO-like enzyme (type II secretory pathway)
MKSLLTTTTMAVLGACLGSFLNVCLHRIPRGENVVSKPSACPCCHHLLPPWLNLPFLGWIISRGKCWYCHAPIHPKYLIWEAAYCVLFLTVFHATQAPGLTLALGTSAALAITNSLLLCKTGAAVSGLAAAAWVTAALTCYLRPQTAPENITTLIATATGALTAWILLQFWRPKSGPSATGQSAHPVNQPPLTVPATVLTGATLGIFATFASPPLMVACLLATWLCSAATQNTGTKTFPDTLACLSFSLTAAMLLDTFF